MIKKSIFLAFSLAFSSVAFAGASSVNSSQITSITTGYDLGGGKAAVKFTFNEVEGDCTAFVLNPESPMDAMEASFLQQAFLTYKFVSVLHFEGSPEFIVGEELLCSVDQVKIVSTP